MQMTECVFDPVVDAETVVDLLRARADRQPDRTAYVFLPDGETDEIRMSYAELDRRARAVAALLQKMGVAGERVLLLYPPGLDYTVAFFGCLYAGVTAVPAYPPRLNRSFVRLQALAADARPALALTNAHIFAKVQDALTQAPALRTILWLPTDKLTDGLAEEWTDPDVGADALAMLQYTSGSTSAPKGVMVSHANLLHNQRMIQSAFGQTEESVIVTWLPLFHDMGLIGNMLQALYVGATCVMMPPMAFLSRPVRWLQAISRYGGTSSGGPNFAFELCLSKITPEERAALDLSTWTVAFNGAEPVRADTMDRFAEVFAECGFRREAFRPCYGLAEATLFVSSGRVGIRAGRHSVDRAQLEQGRVAPMRAGARGAATLVGCGNALPGNEIVVVDPETLTECPSNRVGEIWVAGPNVARGYWGRPEESEHAFHAYLADTGEGPFLRTGDLGFVRDGEVVVTGRLKDLIIVAGRNHYPQDVERTVEESHPSVRHGCVTAFPVDEGGEERLVIAAEVELRGQRIVRRTGTGSLVTAFATVGVELEEVERAILREIEERHDVQAHAVVLLKPGSLPKTTSGKVQRRACRAAYRDGTLELYEGPLELSFARSASAPAA
jgi:acyl-CoA synthetase (AMP-forming)/AMP-acid ligase II